MLSQQLFRQCASLRLPFASDSQSSHRVHSNSLSLITDDEPVIDADEDAKLLRAWKNMKRPRSSGSLAGLVIISEPSQSSKTTKQRQSSSNSTIHRVGRNHDELAISPLAAKNVKQQESSSSSIDAIDNGGSNNSSSRGGARRASATDIRSSLNTSNINQQQQHRSEREFESAERSGTSSLVDNKQQFLYSVGSSPDDMSSLSSSERIRRTSKGSVDNEMIRGGER